MRHGKIFAAVIAGRPRSLERMRARWDTAIRRLSHADPV
jgi:hypothetical protein